MRVKASRIQCHIYHEAHGLPGTMVVIDSLFITISFVFTFLKQFT